MNLLTISPNPITHPALMRGHALAAGGNVVRHDALLIWGVTSNGTKYTVILNKAGWQCPCEQGDKYGPTATLPLNSVDYPVRHLCKHIAAVVIKEACNLTISKPRNLFEMVIGIVVNQAFYGDREEVYNGLWLIKDSDLLRLKKGKVISEPVAAYRVDRWVMAGDSEDNYKLFVEELKES